MGEVEIDNVSLGILEFTFTEMFMEQSSMFRMNFVQIAYLAARVARTGNFS